MKKFFLFALLTALFCSCGTNSKPVTRVLNQNNIKTQSFIIDPSRDTILAGQRGGIFHIDAGTFPGKNGIRIELKEVYSAAEIAYAGLTTESDGRLLESGGMIYFNAQLDGRNIEPLKSISVSIPTDRIDKEMQLFKGVIKPDITINWTDPEPLDSQYSAIDSGRQLFNTNCASCHSPYKDGTGPALAGVEERINNRDILKSFTRNPAQTMGENSYFYCQQQKYNSTMPGFPTLTDRELDLIYDYLQNEAVRRPDLRTPLAEPAKYSVADSIGPMPCSPAPCGFDTIYIDTTRYDFGRDNIMDPHLEATKEESLDTQYSPLAALEEAQRKGFVDLNFTTGRYNFKIKTLGWFNVDAFYERMEGTQAVDLFVKTDFPSNDQLEVHVFFPTKKILTVGTLHESDSLFHFEKYKGQIPLFLNDQAVAFAVGSIKEKLWYGITSFNVQKRQTVLLSIKEIPREQLLDAFREMKLDGIDLDVIAKKRMIVPKRCFDSSAGVK